MEKPCVRARRNGEDMKKIVIAGAGPSGLAAAIVLAKAGREVELHEARPEVGARWKRGLQVIENFSEEKDVLEFFAENGVGAHFWHRPVRTLALSDVSRRRVEFKDALPLGYYVRRGAAAGALDADLLEQARAAGARVIFNSRIDAAKMPWDIFAAGPKRIDGLGKEATFRTSLSDRMSVILDPELAPCGYAYLFVVEGQATLGIAVLERFKEVDSFFDRTAQRFADLDGVQIGGAEVSYSYANFFLPDSLDRSGRLIVGEAGGFQDYLFGFGIRFAITSGVLAARSMLEGVPYDRLWKKTLGRKASVSLFNRFLYEKGARVVPQLFIGLGRRSPSFRAYLRGWYRPSPWRDWGAALARNVWKKRELGNRETKPHDYVELDHR